MTEALKTDWLEQAKRKIAARAMQQILEEYPPSYMDIRGALIGERARNLELRGLLNEVWTTLADVCEFHDDPGYILDVESVRELMKQVYATKKD